MAQRALITGITGQDGSYLAELLLSEGYEVIGLMRRSSTVNIERISHIQERLTLVSGDLMDEVSLINVLRDYRPGEVYNLASGVETSIRELAELINELTGNPTPIALAPAREWDHSGQRYGSTEKAREQLAFGAQIELRDGLARTIEWTRENLDWIERCIAKHSERVQALQAA